LGLRLQQRAEELRAELRAAQRPAWPPAAAGDDVQDLKDRAAESEADRVHDAEELRDLGELAQVEAALARMDAGRYGDCVDCGEPIAASRLAVMPAAPCCAACQAERERHGTVPARHG
jgi:RNA polymerase-binding transcription factor DksA